MKQMALLMIGLFLLSGCNALTDNVDYFEDGMYIGFEDADNSLTINECKEQGFVVVDGIGIIENRNLVQAFIRQAGSGRSKKLRIAHFHDGKGPAYADLIYDSDGYSLFYQDEETFIKEPYKHLSVLKGMWGIPKNEYQMLVISDKKDITFDEVNRAMASSDLKYTDSVGRFRIVFFNY